MNAEIISIGTEILLGEIVDTNANYLANQLPLLGIDLRWVTVVGDDPERMTEAFSRAWKRSDIILATGGLGPTEDDLTREIIAVTLDEKPEVSPHLEKELRSFFARLGWEMSSHNIKQATLIPSAEAIPNPRGTAPGWWIEKQGKIIVAMPGPPKEMQYMWEKEVLPRLSRKSNEVILSRTLKCFGLGEAEVDERISSLFPFENADLGIYARTDGIHLRLIARSREQVEAERILAEYEKRLRSTLTGYIWGSEGDSLEEVVGALFINRGLTLSSMESLTGGLLAHTLTGITGGSSFYKGGLVAGSKQAKVALGVDKELIDRFGEVSAEVADAMAGAVRRHLGADIGIGITGAIGEDEVKGKPEGMAYIAVSNGSEYWRRDWKFPPYSPQYQHYAVTNTLIRLREWLIS